MFARAMLLAIMNLVLVTVRVMLIYVINVMPLVMVIVLARVIARVMVMSALNVTVRVMDMLAIVIPVAILLQNQHVAAILHAMLVGILHAPAIVLVM